MASLKLKSDEVGWIKYSLVRAATLHSPITKKEERTLWDLLDKIEKQEKKQIINRTYQIKNAIEFMRFNSGLG